MKILFVAPDSELKVRDEIMRAADRQTVTFCDGNVDRAKAERFLQEPQDALHFAGHGNSSILEWSDGALEVAELIAMLKPQTRLRFVVITACNSARTGAEIHNALHVPVVLCQAPIGDDAAVRFSEVFYRTYRAQGDVAEAVEAGRSMLARLFPAFADTVVLLNGDMATDSDLSACMQFVKTEIGTMRVQMEQIQADVREMKQRGQQPTWFGPVFIVLAALLLVAQLLTPWLTSLFAR